MTESERIDLLLLDASGELSPEQADALAAWRAADPDYEALAQTLAGLARPLPEPEGAALPDFTRERILAEARRHGSVATTAASATRSTTPWGRYALIAAAALLLIGLAIQFSPSGTAPGPDSSKVASTEVPDVDTILEMLSEPYSSFDDGLGQLDTAVAQVAFANTDPLAALNPESSDDELDQLIELYLMGEG